jgi:hypothetical protein
MNALIDLPTKTSAEEIDKLGEKNHPSGRPD